MEAKKATLSKCTFNREWSGPKGMIYYFTLEWSNGDIGEMSTNRIKMVDNEKIQTKFVIGQEQDYTVEKKVNKRSGETYLFFDKYKEPYNPGSKYSGYSKQADPGRQKRIIKSVALEQAILLKIQIHVDASIIEIANFFTKWVESTAQGDESKAIAAQASLIRSVLTVTNAPEEKRQDYKDLNKVIGLAMHYFNYIMTEDE